MARDIGKVAVGLAVRGEDFDVHEAIRLPDGTNRRFTHAMQRRVNDLQVPRSGAALGHDRLNERGIHFGGTDLDLAGRHRSGEIGLPDILYIHHAFDDRLVVRRHDLAARGPVHLDRIVAGRIVAGRHHDPARALLVADQERKLRGAAIVVQEIDLEPRGDHDAGTQLGKVPRVVPRVIGDCTGQLALASQFLTHVLRQSLGAFPDRPVVNRVAADGVHPAAAASGSERNHGPEHIVQSLPQSLGHMPRDFRGIRGIPGLGQPFADVLPRAGSQLPLLQTCIQLSQGGGGVKRRRVGHDSISGLSC